MSAATVTYIGYVASEGFEQKGDPSKAPFKGRIAISNAVSKLDGSRGPLYKNMTVWPNSPAGEMLKRLEASGKPIRKGSSLIVTGTVNGEEYMPKNATEDTKPIVAEWVTVNQIFFNNAGGSTKPSTDSNASAPAESAPKAAAAGAAEAAPGGGPVLDL